MQSQNVGVPLLYREPGTNLTIGSCECGKKDNLRTICNTHNIEMDYR